MENASSSGINGSSAQNKTIAETDWSGCDVVIEASGKMKTSGVLQTYLDQGVKRVVVTAPVKEEVYSNVVMGVNDKLYDPSSTASLLLLRAPPIVWRRW